MTIRQLLKELHAAAAKIGADSDVEISGMGKKAHIKEVATCDEEHYPAVVIAVFSKGSKIPGNDPYEEIRRLKNKLAMSEGELIRRVKVLNRNYYLNKLQGVCPECRLKLPDNYQNVYCPECLQIRKLTTRQIKIKEAKTI